MTIPVIGIHSRDPSGWIVGLLRAGRASKCSWTSFAIRDGNVSESILLECIDVEEAAIVKDFLCKSRDIQLCSRTTSLSQTNQHHRTNTLTTKPIYSYNKPIKNDKMADKLRTMQNLEAMQARYVGTGHADTTKYDWTSNIVRDSYASYIGHPPLLSYMAVGMGESKEKVRAQMIEKMVRGAGNPPEVGFCLWDGMGGIGANGVL